MGYVLSKGGGYPTVAIILACSYLTSAALIGSLRFPTPLVKQVKD
jgi:hypothetical protein